MKLELRSRCLTDFNVDVLHAAGSFSNVDMVLIVRVGNEGENLGRQLGGVAFGVLGLGCLPSRLLEGGAKAYAYQLQSTASYEETIVRRLEVMAWVVGARHNIGWEER